MRSRHARAGPQNEWGRLQPGFDSCCLEAAQRSEPRRRPFSARDANAGASRSQLAPTQLRTCSGYGLAQLGVPAIGFISGWGGLRTRPPLPSRETCRAPRSAHGEASRERLNSPGALMAPIPVPPDLIVPAGFDPVRGARAGSSRERSSRSGSRPHGRRNTARTHWARRHSTPAPDQATTAITRQALSRSPLNRHWGSAHR